MRTLVPLCVLAAAFVLVLSLFAAVPVHAFDSPQIILQSSFVDSGGNLNVVGTVRNFAPAPVQVTVGVQTDDGRILQAPTYGRVIWPLTDSPFKFVLKGDKTKAGEPFIMDIREIEATYYNTLVLSYDSMAVGEEKAFMGTVKNTGPFAMRNVSVFAAVHSPDHALQLDTVRSNVIPVIQPGEELEFIAIPDPAIVARVLYYSCAGLDYDEPITTLDAGNGKFVAYSLYAIAQVSKLRYESETDSIAFGVRPYAPNGGPLTIKIPQLAQNHTVTVMVDGQLDEKASVRGDGRTMFIDFYVPKGDHQVQIQGVRNVPELPFDTFTLAGATAAAIAAAMRFKAAFKIS
jgi:hypothetical protein